MALPTLFAHCDDALCVAEDSAVAFFAPKTLRKFRVERFSGARVCGMHIQRISKNNNVLHVVDAEGNWFAVTLKNLTVQSSATIEMAQMSSSSQEATSETVDGKSGKAIVAGRRGRRNAGAATGTSAPPAGVVSAHFHEAGGALHCVLLTAHGVSEVALQASNAAALRATPVIEFPVPLADCTAAVGHRTGLVCVAQKGQRWIQHSTLMSRAAGGVVDESCRRVLPIAVETVACSPVSDSVAVGGNRGELIVFPDVADSHYFSDHWHHTALAALSFSVDGASLMTGARESVLLVWDLSSYKHRKITCNLGAIRCVLPSASVGSTLLLACGVSTLATVDLLQMRLQTAVEGIEWSSGQPCSGLVVDTWMGEPVAVLTGLPNVLRLCDPMTQQAVYSLHISSQMETIPNPPHHGIQFAGILHSGRTLVTYEAFPQTALPPMLRFWVYDSQKKQHVEAQTVYKPHDSEVVAMQVDKANGRVFTLSRDCVKCWEEVLEDANDALSVGRRSWRNQSTSPTPSREVASMALSEDGSLCLVADDCVHVFAVADCRPGERWPELFTLCQTSGTAALQDLAFFAHAGGAHDDSLAVVAHDEERVYLWNLAKPSATALVYEPSDAAGVTALCRLTPSSVLVATGDCAFVELSCEVSRLGKVLGEVKNAVGHPVLFAAAFPGQSRRVAVVDAVSGFRVLNVAMDRAAPEQEQFTGDGALPPTTSGAANASLRQYFNELDDPQASVDASDSAARLNEAVLASKAGAWMKQVLQEPAYTAPSMSSVLSLYLKRRSGVQ